MRSHLIKLMAMVAAALTLIGLAAPAQAATKKELRERFEKRYPEILEYKQAGKVGETTKGMLEAVQRKYLDDEKLAKLIEDENADRQELYQIIADDEKTTPDKVAERMARRNYEKARPGEYLKTADGHWKRKT